MRNPLTLLATVVLFVATAAAADHPDMSGTWIIDSSKSDTGPADLSGLTVTVRLEGPEMFIKQVMPGQDDVELHFNTAGEECTNQIGPMKMVSRHRWDGETLLGDYRLSGEYGEATQVDRITYSTDRKQMTVLREIKGDHGDTQMKLVFLKQ